MKRCTIYANCQGDGIAHFLRKTAMAEHYEFKVWRNYQLMLGEQTAAGLMEDVTSADLFIYQPTPGFLCKCGAEVPSTDEMVKRLKPRTMALSFSYQFNTGFFPIVKSGKWWTGRELDGLAFCGAPLLEMYDNGEILSFDCALRFAENLAEQSRRERECVMKFVPFILENFQSKHLFVMHNHPASALFVEMAQTVLRFVEPKWDVPIAYDHPNESNLPGYHAVHPAVIRELGLTYTPDRRGEDAEFYRSLITELAANKGVL